MSRGFVQCVVCENVGEPVCDLCTNANYFVDKRGKEDVVKEPSHYKNGTFETIDEMIIAFGPQRTYDYCIMNAWKYRSRAPFKGNQKQDLEKADYYLVLAKQIQEANRELFYGSFNLIKEDKNVKAE